MNSRRMRQLVGTAILIALLLSACSQSAPAATVLPLNGLALSDSGNYQKAIGPWDFHFPADQGAHDDFQTEWWYYTGNLQTQDGRHFGFELTFFRRAAMAPAEKSPATRIGR